MWKGKLNFVIIFILVLFSYNISFGQNSCDRELTIDLSRQRTIIGTKIENYPFGFSCLVQFWWATCSSISVGAPAVSGSTDFRFELTECTQEKNPDDNKPEYTCHHAVTYEPTVAGDVTARAEYFYQGTIVGETNSTPWTFKDCWTFKGSAINPPDLILSSITLQKIYSTNPVDGSPNIPINEKQIVKVNFAISNSNLITWDESTSVNVTLHFGAKVYNKSVTIHDLILNNDSPFVLFEILPTEGDMKVTTMRATAEFFGTQMTLDLDKENNEKIVNIHVVRRECRVSDIKNKSVKFFSQADDRWGWQDYAHGPANNQTTCKMKSFGCVTTSLAMLFDFYGLNYVAPEINGPPEEFSPGYLNRLFKSTKDLNNQVLNTTYSYSPNNQLTHNNVEPLLVPNVGRSIYSKKCYDEEKQKPGFKDTIAKATCINKSSPKISFIEKPNEWQTTPTNLNQAAKDADFKKIETEICNGNPVLLRVARETVNAETGKLELRKHTVIATESFYENDKLSFYVNDPSLTDRKFAEKQKLADIANRDPDIGHQYKHVIGYTIYKQTADPTMISIFSSPNVDFILTDKLGRRAGFSPISNTFYSEIPNTSYINESIDNADDDPLAEANRPNQNNLIITEDVQDGEYQITLFGKDSGIADLQITKTDSAGFINDTEAFSSPVTSGSTQIFKFNHTSSPLPIVHDDLVINYAQYELARTSDQYNSNSLDKPWQEIKPDKIKIYGDLKLPMGLKATCADSFTFKVGPSNEFNQTLNLSMFKQKSLSGNLFYEYITDDLKIVVSESGLFWIEIKRIDLDSINASKWGQIYVGLNNNLGRVDLNLNCKDRICYGEEIK